ncbi:hypothetical protein [Microbacterium sp. gxy059]|uniref:hypothetical protein n=1 Tax=Microbacterium sp. gxy059 TaxID=2957199 RepID=UPI003D964B3E
MRRLVAPAALLAVLALSGCSSSPAESAEAAPADLGGVCASYADAYESFTDVAHRDGRSDEEMVAARDEMIATWNDAEDEARAIDEDVADIIGHNIDNFTESVSGSAQSDEYRALFLEGHEGLLAICG